MQENKKYLTSNFISTSREQHEHIFRNKTQPPDIGKYHPRMGSVDKKAKVAKILAEPFLSERAKQKKLELDFQNSSICGHIVKNIANFNVVKKNS
jgi:hypothetical protein